MQRQLLKLALTGLFALGVLFASQSTSNAQWWGGYYSSYYSPYYYSSYYSPYYAGYGYSGYYSSYYAPSWDYSGWYGASYAPSCGCSSCGCNSCGCSSGGCGPYGCSSGCSSCGSGGCSGAGCGYACAPDSPNGANRPTPDSKGSGPYDDRTPPESEKWRSNEKPPEPNPGTGAGTGSNDLYDGGRKSQNVQKVPTEPVPQRKEGGSAPDQSQEQPPAPNNAPAADKKAEGPEFQLQRQPIAKLTRQRAAMRQPSVQTLRGLDSRMTAQSAPERTRIQISAGEGRVVIARRVVNPASDWDASTGTRLVQK